MAVRPLHADDAALVDRLIDEHAFKPYRHYRVLSRARQRAVLAAEVARSREVPGSVAVTAGDGADAVAAVGRPLEWDSAFFGVSMGRVDHLLHGPAAGRETLAAVVGDVLARLRAQGVRHVTARVDVGDMDAVAVLIGAGFVLMDALATYFTHPRRDPPIQVREVGTVRPHTPDDAEQILAITRDAYRGFRGRFHLDPHLPPGRSDEFYVEWARQCLAGRMATNIVVADDGRGGIHGWASTRRVEPVSTVGGTPFFAGSLGACRRETPGAYAGLIRTLALANYEAGAVTETQTQNHNVATVRIYEAVGAQYVRGDYTLHAWI